MLSPIKKGSRGGDVVLCQDCLNKHGIPCNIDGVFGPGTEAKIKEFQQVNGLKEDGILNSDTWVKLLSNPEWFR